MIEKPKLTALFRQLIAGSAASLGMLACGSVYAWTTPILPYLLGPDSEIPMNTNEASWIITVPEFGHLISPVPAGLLADRFGRKTVILWSGPLLLIGWTIILYFKTFLFVMIARLIQGLAVGTIFTVTPVYLGEIASPKFRGTIASLFFGFWWFGFLYDYFLGPRLNFVQFTYVSAATSVVFMLLFIWQPESPYYYLMENKLKKASESLTWFQYGTEAEVNPQLERMRQSVEEDKKTKVSWLELIVSPVDRKALIILFGAGSVRQLCGIYALSSYSTETLTLTGNNFVLSADNITLAMGVMMLIGSLCSTMTLDIFGRKVLFFISSLTSAFLLFCCGTFFFLTFHTSVDTSSYRWVPAVSLTIIAGVAVAGIFPVTVAYCSELFTSNTRGTASGLFNIYTTTQSIVTYKFYLAILNNYGAYLNFYIFSVVSLFGAVFACCAMPETKGKSFDEIREKLNRVR